MSKPYFKSGMGADVDPIRLLLLLLILASSVESYDHHNIALLIAAVVTAIVFGWWVTRAWYLDRIELLQKDVEELEQTT